MRKWEILFDGYRSFAFMGNSVKTHCTQNERGFLRTDNIITAMNEAKWIQCESASTNIKSFTIELDIAGINKDTADILKHINMSKFLRAVCLFGNRAWYITIRLAEQMVLHQI